MIKDIKQAIQTAIKNNLNIECYTSMPGAPTPPCVVVVPTKGDYVINFPGNMMQVSFEITLLLSKGDALENVQDMLDTYLLPTGQGSMKAALMQTDLTGIADWIRVTGFDYSGFTISGVEYLGAKWHVQVMI
jgi:hypothetical protein